MTIRIDESLEGIDWARAKADLAADDFDNGRSPWALRASFERSQHVAIARDGDRMVGMARLLSDRVCNAYLLDVWTMSAYRRQGIGTAMVRQLMARVPGQHIGLQTDDAEAFYTSLGYRYQPSSCPPSSASGSTTRPTRHDRGQVGFGDRVRADSARGRNGARCGGCQADGPVQLSREAILAEQRVSPAEPHATSAPKTRTQDGMSPMNPNYRHPATGTASANCRPGP